MVQPIKIPQCNATVHVKWQSLEPFLPQLSLQIVVLHSIHFRQVHKNSEGKTNFEWTTERTRRLGGQRGEKLSIVLLGNLKIYVHFEFAV